MFSLAPTPPTAARFSARQCLDLTRVGMLNLTRVSMLKPYACRHAKPCVCACVSDELNTKMAITGVEGNIKYAATCLQRERQEEALLAKQVLGRERHARP